MEDVLDVYARPYDPSVPVLCIDEKSKELRSEVRESIPAAVGQVRRIDSEYEREGTANIFVCVEPLAGKRLVQVTDQRCLQDFAHFLKSVSDERYRDAKKIVLVVDNLNTHGPHALYETLPAKEAHRLASRFEWHFTPEHGSWLNVAECELSVMSRQCLNRRILDKPTLIEALTAWETKRNTAESIINWQFTTADSRIKLRRLYPIQI
jgi:transposase